MAEQPDDHRVIGYWVEIASTWTDTIRNGHIASRVLVTNSAIVEAIVDRSPATVLDLGCGEGWLSRELAERQMRVTGLDAVPELVDQARAAGAGDYLVMSYEDVAAGKLERTFDVVVCNFSLLGKESTDNVIQRAPALLNEGGALIIQTLHPLLASEGHDYVDGWRTSQWSGITTKIDRPSPWYFRTFGTWIKLLNTNGLQVVDVREPLHPDTGRPASVIFVATVASK